MEVIDTEDLNYYWDCKCDVDYIHPKSDKNCGKCKAKSGEQPDSFPNEVESILGLDAFENPLLAKYFTDKERAAGFWECSCGHKNTIKSRLRAKSSCDDCFDEANSGENMGYY